MIVTHRTKTKTEKGNGGNKFLLSNKKGGYLFLGDNQYSHFCGLTHFMAEPWTLYKTVDDIRLDIPVTEIVNNFSSIKRNLGNSSEKFFYFDKTLFYEVKNYSGGITIDLDMRKIYSNNTLNRIYKIYWEDECVIVEYSVFSNKEHTDKTETAFLIIRGTNRFTLINNWVERKYQYDTIRENKPKSRWIYEALKIRCSKNIKLTFTFGFSKTEAMNNSKRDFDDWNLINSRLKTYAQSIKTNNDVSYSTAVFALENCVCSLNSAINRSGVLAGFPWFFHFWARDELISLKGLLLTEKYSLAKDILIRYASNLTLKGRVPNMVPSSDLGSADAIGWLWKRLYDTIIHLEEKKLLWHYFSITDLEFFCKTLEESIEKIKTYFVEDNLVFNLAQETWMDTHGNTKDTREGFRIEIQCLTLASIKTLFLLYRLIKRNNGKEFKNFEKELLKKTRHTFFDGKKLFDGYSNGTPDKTQRPNIFLAAYVYPELLTKKEWMNVFDSGLETLWLNWGGVSSIEKKNPLFTPNYSGENDISYHRGDSWYFINNICAMVLDKIDSEYYQFQIKAIKNASIKELLWQGIIGHSAEISSAEKQTSFGCLSQAWSSATLIELLDQLKK